MKPYTHRMLADTHPEAQVALTKVMRGMSADQKMQRVYALSRMTRELALTRIRDAHPDWEEARVRDQLVKELYGFRIRP